MTGAHGGQALECKHWTSMLSTAKWRCTSGFVDGWCFFYNRPYSSMNFATNDHFRFHLIIYCKVGQNSNSYFY